MIFIWLQILLPNEKVIYFSCPPHCHYYLNKRTNFSNSVRYIMLAYFNWEHNSVHRIK